MRRAAASLAALFAAAPGPARADDEIIDDPTVAATPATPPRPPPPRRIWHAELMARATTQLAWEAGKDVLEGRTRARLWVADAPDERLAYTIGVRFDALSRTARADGHFVDGAHTFEARPWEAWVDVALADRLRLRVGNQMIAWGKLDVASAADVLGALDLREGPAVEPEALRIPTPSLRATYAPGERFVFEVAYTPFFTPHRFDVAGTNWALVGPSAPAAARATVTRLRGSLDATSFARVQGDLLALGAPSARPDAGEVGAHATWHAGPADVDLTYGWVRSKVPALELDPALPGALAGDLASLAALQRDVAAGAPLVAARYDRYHQLALDTELAAGPVTLAFEVGYTPSRPLAWLDATGLPRASAAALAQAGARVAWVRDERLALSLEVGAFGTPTRAPAGASWLLLGDARALGYAALLAHAEPFEAHEVDASITATTSEPWSLAVLPRWTYRATESVGVGVGAALFAGPRSEAPTVASLARGLDVVYAQVVYRP